jgi:hypothetical protein
MFFSTLEDTENIGRPAADRHTVHSMDQAIVLNKGWTQYFVFSFRLGRIINARSGAESLRIGTSGGLLWTR